MTQSPKDSNLQILSQNNISPPSGLREPIAIIGMGCRFPGDADSPEAFWKLLCDGVDPISEVPADRWNVNTFYDPDQKKAGKIYSRWGGFIKDIDKFDAPFFGISPREATRMDPQQRLLLEVAWEALEDAGQVPSELAGSNSGVFIGISAHDYSDIQTSVSERHSINAYTNLGGAMSIAANRISYVFNFQGPSMIVDTACSSSLVAVHLACQSIWNGESALALAGGVHAIFKPEMTMGFSQASMLSPDGRSFSFDARANGYVRAEGAGVVVLKPLSSALADGDPVVAVIRNTAVNQDGRTKGISVPSGSSQMAILRQAYQKVGIEPSSVQYIEAHGTGTPVGDPIEVKALGEVLSQNREPGDYCLIGSVKSNIGHLEAGSGIAGLIKAALCLKHRQIPPNLHFETPNPDIPFEELQLRVPQRLESFPNGKGLRIAGVNSFGFGGTNAHVVLQEMPETSKAPADSDSALRQAQGAACLLPLSARSLEALQAMAQKYRDFFHEEAANEASLTDICVNASLRREHHNHRLAIVAASNDEMAEYLDAFLAEERRLGISSGRARAKDLKLVFVFSGMGQQWWAMGRELLHEEPVFREVIEQCDELLRPYAGWSLKEELLADNEASSRITETHIAQPALFSLQVALAALWRSWGIQPDAIVGHSVGEVAAAHVAGVLSLQDAIQVIFHRSRLQAKTAGQGKMLALGLSEEEAKERLVGFERRVSIAAINSPRAVTLSGDAEALEQIADWLEPDVFRRLLQVEVPYHSPKMELIKAELLASLQGINPQAATIPLFSTVTGQLSRGPEWDAAYWWQNVRNPVRFAQACDSLMQAGFDIFLEVGAHPVLPHSIKECLAEGNKKATVLPSLRRQKAERVMMLASFGHLYTLGYPVDWNQLYASRGRFPQDASSVRLPSYPWQRERYWNESEVSLQARLADEQQRAMLGQQVHPLLGAKLQSAHPVWDAEIDTQRLSYLSDHAIQGSVVYPAAAYIEMALAAAPGSIVEEIEFHKALFLPDGPVRLQFVLNHDNSFEIYSGSKQEWVRHAHGFIRRNNQQPRESVVLDEIRRHLTDDISGTECYRQLAEMGLEYGPFFQGIERLWRGQTEALGAIAARKPKKPQAAVEEGNTQLSEYNLHPTILDACFQVLLGAVVSDESKALYLPVRIERVRVLGDIPSGMIWSHARLVEQSATVLSGDINLFDDAGNLLVEIQGLRCQSLAGKRTLVGDKAAGASKMDDCLYEYEWQWQPLPNSLGRRPLGHNMPSVLETVASLQPLAERLSKKLRRKHYYEQVEPQLDLLCAAYVMSAFQQLGWTPQLQEPVSVGSLTEQLGILPQHQRLLARMLEMLQEEGVLSQINEQQPKDVPFDNDIIWEVTTIPELKEPQESWRALLAQFPAYQAELTLLGRCGKQLAGVLRGEVDPLELIFPAGSLTVSEHLYQDSPTTRVYNLLFQKAISTVLERVQRPVRILEIGAGTGSMTSYILPLLQANRTEYVFTDVSPLFTAQASEKFREYPFVQYELLDIETDPLAQGFEAHSFDLILASDVLHATHDLRHTLQNVKQLLASQGLLVVLELTNGTRWMDLVFGLLPGWWLFTDVDLRPSHPLLLASQWRNLLSEVGFTEVAGISDCQEGGASHAGEIRDALHTVILAKGPYVESLHEVVSPRPPASWLIFADKEGIGLHLAELLREAKQTAILITPSDRFERLDAQSFQIRPEQPEDYQQLLKDALTSELKGVIHLWSLDIPPIEATQMGGASLKSGQTLGCVSALHLVQALHTQGDSPRLWLVTCATHTVGGVTELEVAQSPLWGLGRVIMNELPTLRCTLVDITLNGKTNSAREITEHSREQIEAFFGELWSDNSEDEIAWRGGVRYVNRLRKLSLANIQPSRGELPPFRLEISTSGILDDLSLRAWTRQPPSASEVEIEVVATALNFKDVAKAMNLLADASLENNFSGRSLGLECAGRIVAIGSGVEGFQIGDEVIALAPNSFGTYTTTSAHLVVHKPAHLTFSEAATIPIVFLTATYALHNLGRLKQGERILIHSAAGGVGLAAIQLAQQVGAEIFATAGNPEKRSFLRALGVQHVMDSRSLIFADQVMELTNGQGVDLVLNSLAGEALVKSFELLAPYGRFLEIGKQDIDQNRKLGLRPFQKNLSFFSIDLDRLSIERPDLANSLLRQITQLFVDGGLHPLPHRVFSISKVVDAFRYMAKAKHIGKIVVSLEEAEGMVVSRQAVNQEQITFPADATTLITGGLGGFGLAVAEWLVKQGVRHLVLMGRSGASSEAQRLAVKRLEDAGAHVKVAKADVTQKEQVQKVLAEIENEMPPLRGIMHGAMVLDDATLLQLSAERIEKVMGPKAIGAWTLHTLTKNLPLDFFVLFSSFASIVGNPGQGNYVAANAFLDALAHHRRTQGKPALTINWGVLSDVGYVAARSEMAHHLARLGANPLSSRQALALLGELLQQGAVQTAVMPMNWRALRAIGTIGTSPRFSHLFSDLPDNDIDSFETGLEPRKSSGTILEQVAAVLGTSPAKVDREQPLSNLGLDSLMAVELTNRLKSELGVEISTMKLMDGVSVDQLINEFGEEGDSLASGSVPQLSAELVQTSTDSPGSSTLDGSSLDGLSPTDNQEMLVIPKGHAVDHSSWSTLIELLRWRASHQPDQRAYTYLMDGERDEVHLTYGELDLRARAIATQLQQMGTTGERALLFYPSGLEFITAFFGCLYASVVAVPTFPPRRNRPDQRLQAIATDSQATIVLTTSAILSDMERLLAHTPELTTLRWLATDGGSQVTSEWQEPVEVHGDTLAFLQYTSGSTGTPKGVMVTHGNLLHNSDLIHNSFGHTPNSQGVTWLPLYHDMGLIGGVLQPLYGGFPVTLMSPIAFLQKPVRWLQAISRYKATTSGGPNFAYDLCVRKITPEERASLDLSSWEVASNGSEPVRAETLERFTATFEACGFRHSAFNPCYGMAENTLFVSGGSKTAPPVVLEVKGAALGQNRVEATGHNEESTTRIVSCGKSRLDQKMVIVDPESASPCPDGQVGEIWVSGRSVAQGYWKQPEKSQQTFHAYLADSSQGPFLRTGDLGFLKEGDLFVTGRLKDLIIIRGRNHYPQDIELTVEKSHPALRPSCCAAFSVFISGEERLVVVQELEPTFSATQAWGRKLDVDKVVSAIRRAVSEQHELQVYAVLLTGTGSVPKTSSGKIQRRACKTHFLMDNLTVIGSSILDLAPADVLNPQSEVPDTLQRQLENRMVYWVANYLKKDIKLIDSTMELSSFGIDSIAVVELSLELEKMVGRPIPDGIVYEFPTIQALAAFLAEFASAKSEKQALNGKLVGNRRITENSPLVNPKGRKSHIALPRFPVRKKAKGNN